MHVCCSSVVDYSDLHFHLRTILLHAPPERGCGPRAAGHAPDTSDNQWEDEISTRDRLQALAIVDRLFELGSVSALKLLGSDLVHLFCRCLDQGDTLMGPPISACLMRHLEAYPPLREELRQYALPIMQTQATDDYSDLVALLLSDE